MSEFGSFWMKMWHLADFIVKAYNYIMIRENIIKIKQEWGKKNGLRIEWSMRSDTVVCQFLGH